MTSARDVVILCWGAPAASGRKAARIAAFLGVEANFVAITTEALAGDGMRVPRCACLIVAADTLAEAAAATPTGAGAIRGLTTEVADHVFVYGFKAAEPHRAILHTLSSGGLLGVRAPSDVRAPLRVAEGHRGWCGQFSGLRLEAVGAARHGAFLENGEASLDVLIRAGEEPFFVRNQRGRAQVFLVACDELADLEAPAGRGAQPMSWFSSLAPLMMFLRGALGDRVWHGESPRACFIVDDPPLNADRYGFLDYRRLADSARRREYSACIAFIPWNYRRSRFDIAALFSSGDRRLGLCIHGCDHTRAEFATTDAHVLGTKARLARERMVEHRRLSGAWFDEVMVFPQGLFSEEAMTALSEAGYLAAVNSDVCPSTRPEALVLSDLLDVAVTRYADVPLFNRRYPRRVEDFAFDLFLGKPVLGVEHHRYFRHGCGALESFVGQLNALDERLEWTTVGTACSSACLSRTTEDNDVQVRFYTRRFRLTNKGNQPRTYRLVPPHTSPVPPHVSVSGGGSASQHDGDCSSVRVTLDAGSTATVSVPPLQPVPVDKSQRPPGLHALRVGLRRRISEFRDNHVETNPVLNAVVNGGRRVVR